jgi:diguanylate cyclase (GGDEF)-like protein
LILLLLVGAMILVVATQPQGSSGRISYIVLIMVLIILDLIAIIAIMRNRYVVASAVIVLISIIGVWGSMIADPAVGTHDFIPLMYTTVSVLLSSIFLSLPATIVISVVQYVLLIFVVINATDFPAFNWPSLLAYAFIMMALSIAVNYLIRAQVSRLQKSAIKDHLTGLFNRRYFDATLDQSLQKAILKESSLGLMLLDIDNFKQYNDRYGHDTGDEVLRGISTFLIGHLRVTDIVCRFGGDEFAIILSEVDEIALYKTAEKIREEVKLLKVMYQGVSLEPIAVSLGLAIAFQHGVTRSELLLHADNSLLAAKQQGKDRIVM